MAATTVLAIAQRHKLDDQMLTRLQRLGWLDMIALGSALLALAIAFMAASSERPRLRTLAFVAALVANVWNLVVV